MNKLYAFHWDCGRSGDINGLFVADDKLVNDIVGSRLHFGEILGKHSDISGTLDLKDLTVKSEDQDFINKLVEVIGSTTISGYNPLGYLPEEDDEE